MRPTRGGVKRNKGQKKRPQLLSDHGGFGSKFKILKLFLMFHKAPSVLLTNNLEQSALLLRGPTDRHAGWFNPEIWGYLVRKAAIERSVRQWGGSCITLTCEHGLAPADCLACNTRTGRHSGTHTKPQRRRERCISIGKSRDFYPKPRQEFYYHLKEYYFPLTWVIFSNMT